MIEWLIDQWVARKRKQEREGSNFEVILEAARAMEGVDLSKAV